MSESTASLQCRHREAQVTIWYTDSSFSRQRQRESRGRLAAMASTSFPSVALFFNPSLEFLLETFRSLLLATSPSFLVICFPSELTMEWLDTETRGLIFLLLEGLLTTCWSKLALLFATFGDTCWSRLALLLCILGGGPDLLLGTRSAKRFYQGLAYKLLTN